MEELKKCPFCNGQANISYNAKRKDAYGRDIEGTAIACENCGATIFFRSRHIAIEAWNRRTVPTMAQILANILDGTPLLYPCVELWSPEGWCKDHCESEQQEPDAECWLKYAEVIANEQQAEGHVSA